MLLVFQEYFVTALLSLVVCGVITKLVISVALYFDDKFADKVEVVEEKKKVLRVKGSKSKSKKRVKFADDVVVKHVDYMVEDDRREFEDEIKSGVNYYNDYDCDDFDDVCESSGVSVESMEEVMGEEKGEILTRVELVDDDQRLIVEEKCENLKRVDQVDDHRVLVEEEKGEILTMVELVDEQRLIVEEICESSKRVDQVDDQRVLVEEKCENSKRVDQVDDQRALIEEKREILTKVEIVDDDQRLIVEEKCENSKRVDQVDDHKVLVEEKGEILTRVELVDEQRLIVEEKCEDSKRVDQVDDQRVLVEDKCENSKSVDQMVLVDENGENSKRVDQVDDLDENGENSKRVEQVDDQRVLVEEKGEILTKVELVDDQRLIVEGKCGNSERIDEVDDQSVLVDENGENSSRVEQVDDQRMLVDEKGENSSRVEQADDQRVLVDENGENSKKVDQVKDQRVIVEEKGEKGPILERVDQFDDHTSNEEGKVTLCCDEVRGVCVEDGEILYTNPDLWFQSFYNELDVRQKEIEEFCCAKKENAVIRVMESFLKKVMIVLEESEDTSSFEDFDSETFEIALMEFSKSMGMGETRGGLSKGDESSSVKDEYVVINDMDIPVVAENFKHEAVRGTSGSDEKVSAISDVAIELKEESCVVELGANRGGLRKGDEETKVTNEGVIIDDDWEGIERTELEKRFGEAVNHVECGVKTKDDRLANLGSDVQMQLYGLHKIAVEGSCHEPQPMALNFSARAKWNAWQKLGSMSREVAMEEYIKLLSEYSKSSLQDIQPNVISERIKFENN